MPSDVVLASTRSAPANTTEAVHFEILLHSNRAIAEGTAVYPYLKKLFE
jgi:hypothetical protein